LPALKLFCCWILLACSVASVASEPDSKTVKALQFRPLEQELQSVVSDPRFQNALLGVRVDSLSSGKTVFSHHPDWLLNPASVSKIFTTAAALCLLHPEFRFKTELYALKRPERGVVSGPLFVKGYGDPFFVSERLTYLAMELHATGLKKIAGPFILDDTYFDDVETGPGWSQDESSEPYEAPMGALSTNFNAVSVLVFPGERPGQKAQVELLPSLEAFRLENQAVTSARGTRIRARVLPAGHQTKVEVRGQIGMTHPGVRTMVRITQPTWQTAYAFADALARERISIRKEFRLGTVPEQAELIFTFRSPSLGDLVRVINKRSQNFMAEQLFKTLGAEFLGAPGSWWKGQQVLNAFLEEEVGIPSGTYVIHNGSGLNDTNRVSASQTVTLLRYMWGRPDVRPDFEASLAVSGADGTIANRFTDPDTVRTMRLKTGSLRNVRALAGYVINRNHEVFAFAFFASQFDGDSRGVLELIDRFASALARTDANHQVVGEAEVLPFQDSDDSLILPIGPPEGIEESEIPLGEKPPSRTAPRQGEPSLDPGQPL
jgi:serine-type D-Ala-D-Ala carboxypeptidase/endopeptidase (penicillin-binding protein 4)